MAWVVLGDHMRCEFPFGKSEEPILPVVVSRGVVFRDAPRRTEESKHRAEGLGVRTWRTQDVRAQGIL